MIAFNYDLKTYQTAYLERISSVYRPVVSRKRVVSGKILIIIYYRTKIASSFDFIGKKRRNLCVETGKAAKSSDIFSFKKVRTRLHI